MFKLPSPLFDPETGANTLEKPGESSSTVTTSQASAEQAAQALDQTVQQAANTASKKVEGGTEQEHKDALSVLSTISTVVFESDVTKKAKALASLKEECAKNTVLNSLMGFIGGALGFLGGVIPEVKTLASDIDGIVASKGALKAPKIKPIEVKPKPKPKPSASQEASSEGGKDRTTSHPGKSVSEDVETNEEKDIKKLLQDNEKFLNVDVNSASQARELIPKLVNFHTQIKKLLKESSNVYAKELYDQFSKFDQQVDFAEQNQGALNDLTWGMAKGKLEEVKASYQQAFKNAEKVFLS